MKLTLDIENTVTERGGKMHLDPFEPENSLVMVGMLTDQGDEYRLAFDHDEYDSNGCVDKHGTVWSPVNNNRMWVQKLLDQATVLIMHNAAYDLLWLWESGFTYTGPVFDTMLAEYVLQRGIKEPLSLEACAERYELDAKKQDTLKEYFKKGYSTRSIPLNELDEYLSADLHATQQLSDKLMYRLNTVEDAGLMKTVDLTNRVAVVLAEIYRNGFSVDKAMLEDVRKEFEKEKQTIEKSLNKYVKELMGDTPINLNSPEQMSWVIYSRRPTDKTMWKEMFNPGMGDREFKAAVNNYSSVVHKTKAVQCFACYGTGREKKVKKDGTPYAKQPKCKSCNAVGFNFVSTGKIAGLKFKAPDHKWISANGFSVNKQMLDRLENTAKKSGYEEAEKFMAGVKRLSALDTYLSSFVDGIQTHTKEDGRLHVRLLQHRTSTGRFSGADPNMQNMPRGGTFPVKKVFVSRWDGGKILEADFAQLEFRTAAYLSQDGVAIEEVSTGFDVHAYTAEVITNAGQPTSRQDAKAHTFAPLYGATGFGRTQAEAAYYSHFTNKYKGVASWHTRLAKEAISTRKIVTPTGREFAFPDIVRKSSGSVSHFTQIKNYPVQSFATADIVPAVLIHINKKLKYKKSCIVNSVHDSIVIDIHPDEEQEIINTIKDVNNELNDLITLEFGITLNVPLLLESKIGNNWLDTKDVA